MRKPGYIQHRSVWVPGHHRAVNGGVVPEHVVVVERATGKPLPGSAEVHHVDGNPRNNAPDNLVVCEDHAYHMLLHRRQKAYASCGHAGWHKCKFCKEWGPPNDMRTPKNGPHNAWHHACRLSYRRERYRLTGAA